MEKLLELRREYLQEVVARGGGQAREYLEEVAMASRGECREVEMGEFRAEVDESKRPRKARWGFHQRGELIKEDLLSLQFPGTWENFQTGHILFCKYP